MNILVVAVFKTLRPLNYKKVSLKTIINHRSRIEMSWCQYYHIECRANLTIKCIYGKKQQLIVISIDSPTEKFKNYEISNIIEEWVIKK